MLSLQFSLVNEKILLLISLTTQFNYQIEKALKNISEGKIVSANLLAQCMRAEYSRES
jgi:hypothetical protein